MDIVIILGDFNDNTSRELIIGTEGLRNMDENGELLVDFFKLNYIVVRITQL